VLDDAILDQSFRKLNLGLRIMCILGIDPHTYCTLLPLFIYF